MQNFQKKEKISVALLDKVRYDVGMETLESFPNHHPALPERK